MIPAPGSGFNLTRRGQTREVVVSIPEAAAVIKVAAAAAVTAEMVIKTNSPFSHGLPVEKRSLSTHRCYRRHQHDYRHRDCFHHHRYDESNNIGMLLLSSGLPLSPLLQLLLSPPTLTTSILFSSQSSFPSSSSSMQSSSSSL